MAGRWDGHDHDHDHDHHDHGHGRSSDRREDKGRAGQHGSRTGRFSLVNDDDNDDARKGAGALERSEGFGEERQWRVAGLGLAQFDRLVGSLRRRTTEEG